MAQKTEDLETDTMIAAKGTELKKELQTVLKSILEEDDFGIEAIVEAMRILGSLKESKFKQKSEASFGVDDNIVVPQVFRCPISKEIMSDPVILNSGKTYDRVYIESWPETQHIDLTPNHLVRDMISKWCKKQGMKLPQPAYHIDEVIVVADRGYLNSLLHWTSSTSLPLLQKAALIQVRQLTKWMPFYRALFGESDPDYVINRLIPPVSVDRACFDIDFQDDLVATVLNISIHENNKKLVAENQNVMDLLIDALYTPNIEINRNAAAALFTLSALDSNRITLGRSHALNPLMYRLEEGNPLDMKYVASAIFKLCINRENRDTAHFLGAVTVVIENIKDRKFVDELLGILAILSSLEEAVDEMMKKDAVPCLLSILKESTSEDNKENCVFTLDNICNHYKSPLRKIREDKNAYKALSKLAESRTFRAKTKANSILDKVNGKTSITFLYVRS